MENETIKERFLGTIFGQAVGDALGLSTEFMSKQEVDRFYPNGIEQGKRIKLRCPPKVLTGTLHPSLPSIFSG